MATLLFTPEASAALDALEANPSKTTLVTAIWDGLDALAADPGCPKVRQRRYQAGAWGFVLRPAQEVDYLILWRPGPGSDENTAVYIGPDLGQSHHGAGSPD